MQATNYNIKDVEALKPFISTAVVTGQITKSSSKGIVASLKECLNLSKTTDKVQLLTMREGCSILKCSRVHLYNLHKKGIIRIIKVGGSSRLVESEINILAGGTAHA